MNTATDYLAVAKDALAKLAEERVLLQNRIREIDDVLRDLAPASNPVASRTTANREKSNTSFGSSGGKRLMSEEGRERIAAAQRARWERFRSGQPSESTGGESKAGGAGKGSGSGKGSGKPAPISLPLQDLKALLAEAPNKTINIRKANLELKNIATLARVNPGLLKMGGKGPWPTVTLLR